MYFVEIATIENSRLLPWVRVFGSSDEDDSYSWALGLRRGFSTADRRPTVRLVKSPQDTVVKSWRD